MHARLVSAVILSLSLTGSAIAQCATQWLPGSMLTSGPVHAFARTPAGEVVAGGAFTQIEGFAANNVARLEGASWRALGTGVDGPVYGVGVLPNGDIVVGGEFSTAGGITAIRVARWNGTAWSNFGIGWQGFGSVADVLVRADGTLVVAGSLAPPATPFTPLMRVATWNGSSWTDLPIPAVIATLGVAHTLLEDTNGDLLIGGRSPAGGCILRWNGVTMQTVATTTALLDSRVLDLARRPSGELIAVGNFQTIGGVAANHVASWNGTTWSALGSGLTFGGLANGTVGESVVVLPDGDVVVGGTNFTEAGGVPANGIARWDGSAWSAFGGGVTSSGSGFSVHDLAFPPAGPLFVGGNFQFADGAPDSHLARVGTTCPTTSNVFGYGCGTNTLAVTKPAWANGTFEAVGTGLPSVCWIITVTSLSAVTPGLGMDLVYPMGVPGCDLFVAPDILGLALTTTGTATSGFFLPDSPPIVGVTFHHQWIPWEIQNGLVTSITATNALQLTAGAF